MIIHRRNTFNLKIFRNQKFSSIMQVNTFYKLAYRLQLKELKGFGKILIRPTFSYFSNAKITILLLSIFLFICGY